MPLLLLFAIIFCGYDVGFAQMSERSFSLQSGDVMSDIGVKPWSHLGIENIGKQSLLERHMYAFGRIHSGTWGSGGVGGEPDPESVPSISLPSGRPPIWSPGTYPDIPVPIIKASPFIQLNDTPAAPYLGPALGFGPIGFSRINQTAINFGKKYKDKASSVAGIYVIRKDDVQLLGTGFLVRSDLLATARHVARKLLDKQSRPFEFPTKADTQATIVAIFGVTQSKYRQIEKGLLGYKPETDTDAVILSAGTYIYPDEQTDLSFVKIPVQISRAAIEISTKEPGRDLIVIGVPDRPSGGDQLTTDRFCRNYLGITDIQKCRDELPSMSLAIYSTTGVPIDTGEPRNFGIVINSNMGNSGSPVIDVADGKLRGVLVENSLGSRTHNTALKAKEVIRLLDAVRA